MTLAIYASAVDTNSQAAAAPHPFSRSKHPQYWYRHGESPGGPDREDSMDFEQAAEVNTVIHALSE